MVSASLRCIQMVSDGLRWSQIVSDGLRWSQMVSDGLSWLISITIEWFKTLKPISGLDWMDGWISGCSEV